MLNKFTLLVTLGTSTVKAIDYICLIKTLNDEYKYEVVNQTQLNALCPTGTCECSLLMTKCQFGPDRSGDFQTQVVGQTMADKCD